MLRALKIENFRGIKKLDTDALRRVNLFFGKNNCGKSSLLEAVFWLFGRANPRIPSTLNITRGIFHYKKENFQALFYGLNDKENISIVGTDGNGVSRTMNVDATFVPERKIDNSEITSNALRSNIAQGTYELKIFFSLGGIAYDPVYCSVRTDMDGAALSTHPDTTYQESEVVNYLPPSRGDFEVTKAITHLFLMKQESRLTEALSKIDPRVRDLVLAGNEVFVDFGGKMRLPLSVSGDGMRKIFHLLSVILSQNGGGVIIDEIDNGLHYSAMKSMWVAVLEAAKQSNRQLFITTHNIDSLKALSMVLEEHIAFRGDVLTANLVRHTEDDTCEIIPYDFSAFKLCIDQEIEMR